VTVWVRRGGRLRLARPEEWRKVDDGVWEIDVEHRTEGGKKICVRRLVMYGSTQCELCGQPIERSEGEPPYCHQCMHAVMRYQRGELKDPSYIRRIEEYLEVKPGDSSVQRRIVGGSV